MSAPGPPDVDPERIRDEESDLIFGYANQGDDIDKMKLISQYLPEKTDYAAKTVLAKEHPEIMAAIENLVKLFPEIEHMEDEITTFVYNFEKRQTSVHGRSREEFLDILTAMSGGSRSDYEDRVNRMEQLLTPINEQGSDEE